MLGLLKVGNKNSGRKSRYEEIQAGNILKITTAWLCSEFHTFDKDTKIKVALAIVPRGVKQQIEHSGDALKNTVVVQFGDANGIRREQSLRAQ